MPNLTLSVPRDLYEEMKKHPEIRWSEIARQALAKKLEDLRLLDEILAKSKLTEKDVEDLSSAIKKGVGERYRRARTQGRG
ncbi:MAG: hypothetical protein A3K65_06410 [Euryarchaeota archaeon RBG_16_68_12]|nr:MAG: hypothetical protein A3K65_06410 [Euryarchaeota archaeon RBG_16_68_12]